MMNLPTLYLHIGQTKTATTALQLWLSRNRQALAAGGVLFPAPPADHPDQHQHRFLLDALFQGPPALRAAWAMLEAQIAAQADVSRVVITEELLWHLHSRAPDRRRAAIEQLREVLSPYPVKVVVTLRRQDHWVESWHNQLVKSQTGPLSQLSLEAFVPQMEEQNLLDYEALIADWVDVFGDPALLVLDFQPAEGAHTDPIARFASKVLGLTDLSAFEPAAQAQRALSYPALLFATAFNRLPQAEAHKPGHLRMLRAADALQTDRRRRLSAATANRLLETYQAGNQRIAEQLMPVDAAGRPATLFAHWLPADNTQPPPPAEPLASEVLGLMAQMFVRQEARLNRLQQRLDERQPQRAAARTDKRPKPTAR